MKLRNKKTGEIGHLRSINWNETALIIMDKDGVQLAKYNSLAELNEEWEDYEEPKEYWYIRGDDSSIGFSPIGNCEVAKRRKEIGNYFETREEAEKAIEKLKAWKRLKGKGFRFDGWEWKYQKARYIFDFTVLSEDGEKQAEKDLDLLFGGGK